MHTKQPTLENKYESLSEVHGSVKTNKKGFRRILAFLGPAYLVSVGYMDPGNWATDIAGGSQFGYQLIWVLLMSNLIAILLQSLSTRLGIVAGMDLAQANRHTYAMWANVPLWLLAEIAIAATDLAEIIGMAIGLNLVFDLPLVWGICITALDTILFLFLLHRGMRVMEAFIISMISIVGVCFVLEMFIVSPDYGSVVKGLIPTKLSGDALYITIGIIGATVMPHNLYLHSSLVQSRQIKRTTGGLKRAIRLNLLDTTIALNLAFFVNAAILILAAAAFYSRGFFEVAEIQDASVLLEEIFGKTAPLFFGIALIAAGQSSTVTGTLAGQVVMEGHLNLRIQPWLRRLITRAIAIIPALFTIIFFGERALGALLILSQVILSLQLGFAVIPLVHFTSSKKLMGDFAIKLWVKVLAWVCTGIILYLNIQLVIQEIQSWISHSDVAPWVMYGIIFPLALYCLFLLFYVFIHPMLPSHLHKEAILPHGLATTFEVKASHPFTNIVVAIDFSKKDEAIIRNALKQGGKEAQYTLVHVVESAAARYLNKRAYDQETQLDDSNLQKYGKQLQEAGFNATTQIGFGSPTVEIVRIVKENNADLMVMGAHGHRAFKDVIYGSVAERVRHKLNIPVLIVK